MTTLCRLQFLGDSGSAITDDIGTVVNNHGVTISTATDPLGRGFFDGSSYLTLAPSLAAAMAASAFTVEFWFSKYSDGGSAPYWGHPILTQPLISGGGNQLIAANPSTVNSGTPYYGIGPAISGTGDWDMLESSQTVGINIDTHIAFVADGAQWRCYINGVHDTTLSRSAFWNNTGSDLNVGLLSLFPPFPHPQAFAKCYLWDLIITQGVKYTADFTPATRSYATATIDAEERRDSGGLTGFSLLLPVVGSLLGYERGDKSDLSGIGSVSIIQDYLSLFTRQHRGKPKLEAWMSVLLQPLIDTQIFFSSINHEFDLDSAVGAQLDILGEWIGLSRNLYEAYAYFRYDSGPGFGLGSLKGTLGRRDPIPGGSWTFLDDQYRHMLRAKILYNRWDGSTSQAASILSYLVGATASVVTIHDSQFILLLPESIDDSYKAVLDSGLFNFRPAGVNLAAIVYFGQVFSFDNTSSTTCGGFNFGSLS